MGGYKFVRQEPIGSFVDDFVCREQRIIVEVDGGQHAANATDIQRDEWLKSHGYRVLRFWNNDVLQNTSGVLQMISDALYAESPPHPVLAKGEDRPLPASGER